MATPADQRLLELLDKWLNSLELHAKYSGLDDHSYWKIQPWVEHQRPTRWIIDLAMQKTVALRTHVEERVKMGDTRYSDSLELMIFLANLVGSEHIERFIPAADAANERSLTAEPAEDTAPAPASGATATREMPKFLAAKRAPPPAGTAQVARTERRAGGTGQTGGETGRQTTGEGRGLGQARACPARSRQGQGRAGRARGACGGGPRAGHRRCCPLGSMGTQVVRIA